MYEHFRTKIEYIWIIVINSVSVTVSNHWLRWWYWLQSISLGLSTQFNSKISNFMNCCYVLIWLLLLKITVKTIYIILPWKYTELINMLIRKRNIRQEAWEYLIWTQSTILTELCYFRITILDKYSWIFYCYEIKRRFSRSTRYL